MKHRKELYVIWGKGPQLHKFAQWTPQLNYPVVCYAKSAAEAYARFEADGSWGLGVDMNTQMLVTNILPKIVRAKMREFQIDIVVCTEGFNPNA